MRVIEVILAVTTVGVLATAADADAPSEKAQPFHATTLGPSRSAVQFDLRGVIAVGVSAIVVCETAALAVDRGFSYFRIENERVEVPKKGSFEVALFHSPPAGVKVLRADSPPGSARFKVARFHQVLDGGRHVPTGPAGGGGRRGRGRQESAAPASPSDDPAGRSPDYAGVTFGAGRRWVSR